MIPPTLLVGLTPPAMTESVIFLILLGVMVDPVLLFGCAIAVLLGGLVGAPLVVRARVWVVQLVVAAGLILAAIAYAMTNLNLMPGGGNESALPLSSQLRRSLPISCSEFCSISVLETMLRHLSC